MELLGEEGRRLLRLGLLPGLLGGGLAVAFRLLLDLLLLVPPLALPLAGGAVGLFSAWLYRRLPDLRGGGVDRVLLAYHLGQGRLPPRLGPLKALLTALTLGLGGSGGQEGPLLYAGGALAQALRPRNPAEARAVLLAGGAAAIAALFHTPLGAAFFAAEVLYRGSALEGRLLGYLAVAAISGYGLQSLLFGTHPLLPVQGLEAPPLWFALALAPLAALGAWALARGLAWSRARLQGPAALPLALAASGTLALLFPPARGTSYEGLAALLQGEGPNPFLFLLAKALAVLLSAGSGASVGLFGPSVVLGGALGAALGALFGIGGPGPILLGLVALVSAAARTPFAAVVQMVEITGSYALLVPGLLVAFGAFALNRETLFPLQPPGPEASPAHAEDLLRGLAQLPPGRPLLLGDLGAVLLEVREGHPWAGKPLKDTALPPGVLVGLVFRQAHLLAPRGQDRLEPGDRVLLLGPKEEVARFAARS
ncbi:chloride channel protein [Thermus thermophilus]|uniref:chloride channel protein n=1 Tax=Thermus thermophilus TaxID=274 RepID=UPI0003A0592C|nr:chloride channel protein [Thermus thermophilus]